MHRKALIKQLGLLYSQRKHVLLVGAAGMGKTRILFDVNLTSPLQICAETSSLGRICTCLERHLGWNDHETHLIERKNRLLNYLQSRNGALAFDDVATTPPRVARLIADLTEHIPIWIACRSDTRKAIGHIWSHLYKFIRIEIPPLTAAESAALIEQAISSGRIAPAVRPHYLELHRLSQGVPGIMEDLLAELAHRDYRLDDSFSFRLLDLDRRMGALRGTAHPKNGRTND
jgi:hypothetical protein